MQLSALDCVENLRRMINHSLGREPSVTPRGCEEFVFQHMYYRKLERQLRGTYKNDKPWTILWTFLTLLLLFGLIAPNFVNTNNDNDDSHSDSKKSFDIRVNIRDLGFLSLMAIVSTVTLVYTLTRVVVVVRWSLYWLLATLSILYLWKREFNIFSNDTPLILLVGFGVLEFLTFFMYILLNFIYPHFVQSEVFRKNVGITWWFSLKPITHWTLTYAPSNWFESRRTCTYRGETDVDGYPHGFGNWLDDSFHGELLSGMWERGEPVGPFRSREFGSGFAFESLRIGYLHCSDDTFTSRKYFPSQNKLPTIGIASVECSVAGGFFSHLPRAVIREGPYCLATIIDDEEQQIFLEQNLYAGVEPHYPLKRIVDLLPYLKVLYTEHPSSSLIITATKGRGVLVAGHSLESEAEPNQLVIDIIRDDFSQKRIQQEQYQHQLHQEELLSEQDVHSDGDQTDDMKSSLYLASGVEEEEDSMDYIQREDTNYSSIEEEEELDDSLFHTPLLHTQDNEDDRSLYFNLSHIPAATATFQNQLLHQQEHLLHRPHSNVFQGSRFLVSQPRYSQTTQPNLQNNSFENQEFLSQSVVPGPHFCSRILFSSTLYFSSTSSQETGK